jgi:cytochrome c oxidase subunit IV
MALDGPLVELPFFDRKPRWVALIIKLINKKPFLVSPPMLLWTERLHLIKALLDPRSLDDSNLEFIL